MNEYEKQAQEFCEKYNVIIITEFLKNGLHFPEDTIPRNIYRFTIIRNKKTYRADFGQSIAESKKGVIPQAYDILACITKYDPGTFGDFCVAYGYDGNTKIAKTIYKAVTKEWGKISELFSDILDELREIQ